MKSFQVRGIDRCGIIERIKGFLREGNNIEARKNGTIEIMVGANRQILVRECIHLQRRVDHTGRKRRHLLGNTFLQKGRSAGIHPVLGVIEPEGWEVMR